MLTQLRRFHRSDWDSAVNGREQRFRDELYALFNSTYMRPVDSNINLKIGSKRVTDIDGAVWDSKKRYIGIVSVEMAGYVRQFNAATSFANEEYADGSQQMDRGRQ